MHDLTQMFGEGNEPKDANEFYARIPKEVNLYKYNEGEIVNMTANAIKSTGFNQWDEQWEVGYLNSSGQNSTGGVTGYIRSKNYIRVVKGR